MKIPSILILAFTVFAFSLTGCTTAPISMSPSNTPLQGVNVKENLGPAEGSDKAVSILGIYMIGYPDIEAALKQAIKSKNGDALINVRCYETFSYFFLFSISTVKVSGEAVTFAPVPETPAPGTRGRTR